MRTADGKTRVTGRVIGDMLPARAVKGDRDRKVRYANGGPLTGTRVVVVRGPRAGVEGVLRDRYMSGPGYYAKLDDGCETVLRPWDFRSLAP